MSLKIGVVGATGMVGEVFMEILARKNFSFSELRPFASEKSLGTNVKCNGKEWPVQVLKDGCFDGLDLVFFSSGDDISAEWAPKAVEAGAFAVDNSAAFRMKNDFPLIVPEVNGHLIPKRDRPTIIANPNCSTIQLVVALKPLDKLGLKEVRVASYQSVSGAGKEGRKELLTQIEKGADSEEGKPKTFPHPIAFNVIPQIGSFNAEGFCSEEVKIIKETKKIMERPDLKVSAFTVRVPSLNSHSEAVWVTFEHEVERAQIVKAFQSAEGLVFDEQNSPSSYPTSISASGTDPVYVGRLHRDYDDPKTWIMWVVADNILKGAALNGLQIAEKIFK